MQTIYQASALVLLAAVSVSAQGGASSLSALPECAKTCVASSPAHCNLDIKCTCEDKDYLNTVSCCVAKACSADDFKKTLSVASQLCTTVGVQIPSAAPGDCAGGSGGSGSSPSSSSSAASPPSGTSSTPAAAAAAPASASSKMSSSSTMNASMTKSAMAGEQTSSSSSSATSSAAMAGSTSGAALSNSGNSKIGAIGAVVAALALF